MIIDQWDRTRARGEGAGVFAEVVRAQRQRQGLTQEELAAKAGLGVRTVRKIEAGSVGTPRPATVRLLADAFGLVDDDRERFCQTAAGEPTEPATRPNLPAQLPAEVSAFTGRDEELAYLDALLARAVDQPNAVVISALSGTAGVGKTALAVHWAHRIRDRFPDGQLYVNLRGYDPDKPMAPADALARFLTALGMVGPDLPQDLDDRAARYRSELVGRRMLIMLDNAGSVDQVRPLLPGSSSSTVVVTSRDSLTGLIAVDGARRLELDLLQQGEAVTLLRRLIGPRVDAEPQAADTLAGQCARLPLALRVAAELAVFRPAIPLAELVVELADQQRRLDLLGGGDPHTAVRTVFSWSIQHLPHDAAGTFRLLGLHPGPDIEPYAAAALADTSIETARRRLELLTRAHLLNPTGPGRYSMHDLLRAYAADLARICDSDQSRDTALTRLLDHYRHTASVAMDLAYPYERERRPSVPPAGTPAPGLPEPAQAIGWLDVELPNLLAAAHHAARSGSPEHTWHLSAILHRHLRTCGHYRDAEALHHRALTTAHTRSDRAGEFDAQLGLGHIHRRQGRYQPALEHYRQALKMARTTGNLDGKGEALRGLGDVHWLQGRYLQAMDHFGQVLQITRSTGNHAGELNAHLGLGHINLRQGQHEQAIDHFGQVLQIARSTGNHAGELNALFGLGHLHWLQGRYGQATESFGRVLEIARLTGHRTGELDAMLGLGWVDARQGKYEQATDRYQGALDLAREISSRNGQFEAFYGLGRLHRATGNADESLTHHRQALALATDLAQPSDQARAHDGLAHAHHHLGQLEQARLHWKQALDILTGLGVDHTEDGEATTSVIRAHLAALDQAADPIRPPADV
jgi:tetratricopeptide (TPR) repeat protein/transcriptional regulator with XRE-family HTH domain